MVKRRSGKGRKGKKKAAGTPRRAAVRPVRMLDGPAVDHAKLLLDPCGAKLSHPVYSGGEGGYLVRTESINQICFGVGVTGGVLHWVPGAINITNTEQLWNNSVGGAATAVAAQAGAPGKSFLQNASLVRCVAACIRISYAGSEASRAGRIYYGRSSGSLVNVGDLVAPETLAGALPHFSRTPVGDIEIVWLPNDADQQFIDPNEAAGVNDRRRRAAVTIAAAGLPADVGLIVRQTAIYEWQPIQSGGIAVPANSRARSVSTLDQVVNAVQAAMQGGSARVGASFGSALGAGARGAFAGLMSSMYGNIPAMALTRTGGAMIGY